MGKELSLEYNTERSKLILSEYGRSIQKMVDYATKIEDVEKRQKVANEILTLMGQLNPHLRDIADYKHKLYDHLFIISDFKLDLAELIITHLKPINNEYSRIIKDKNYIHNSLKIGSEKARKVASNTCDTVLKNFGLL